MLKRIVAVVLHCLLRVAKHLREMNWISFANPFHNATWMVGTKTSLSVNAELKEMEEGVLGVQC
jgi:hypothetical protein